MSITVLNYMDQALVDRIHSQAAKRAETAKQTTSDDFATVLADSTKAIENNQNTISTNFIGITGNSQSLEDTFRTPSAPIPPYLIHRPYPQVRLLHHPQVLILRASLTLFSKMQPIPMVFLLLY